VRDPLNTFLVATIVLLTMVVITIVTSVLVLDRNSHTPSTTYTESK